MDALSDDGRTGLVLIAFIGSVFSPYYARARRRGPADPEDYCALNVAVYVPGAKRWAMTERGRGQVRRSDDALSIGSSTLSWDGAGLTVQIDEIAVPAPRPVRGTVRIRPSVAFEHPVALSTNKQHYWSPIAPRARVEVALSEPALRWKGLGYLDCNWGSEPLETAFTRWTWSRAALRDRTAIVYDTVERIGTRHGLAFESAAGTLTEVAPPPLEARLPTTMWRLDRVSRMDAPGDLRPRVIRTLEDTPFYARTSLAMHWRGEAGIAMHESLSLDRFSTLPVQLMLPFRMPRRCC